MNIRVYNGFAGGKLAAIPSKSAAHRLLILSALADAPTRLRLPRFCEDIDATVSCLKSMGARIERLGEELSVCPVERPAEMPLLDCRESGSTLRFLLPVASAVCGGARFTGSGRLPERPLGELMSAMRANGAEFSCGKLPFTVKGRIRGGEYSLPGGVSSQYLTGLLLALPLAEGKSVIRLTSPLESAAYADMTMECMRLFGLRVSANDGEYTVQGGKPHSPGKAAIEGDWSNAAFFLVAGAIAAPVCMSGLSLLSSQGDRRILQLLDDMGAEVSEKKGEVRVSPARLFAQDIDVSGIPDLLPPLAVAAAFCEGETRFYGGARLRLKESDRISSTAALINSLGGSARELADGLIVGGQALTGGCVKSFGDHRIAMAAAIAALRCKEPVIIEGAEATGKSYPLFFEDLLSLGGKSDVL